MIARDALKRVALQS